MTQRYLYHTKDNSCINSVPCSKKALEYIGPKDIISGSRIESKYFRHLNGADIVPCTRVICDSCQEPLNINILQRKDVY